MGDSGMSEMQAKYLDRSTDGKCASLRYVAKVQQCRALERECSSTVEAGLALPDSASKLQALKHTFCPFSSAADGNSTALQRAPCNMFGECVRESLAEADCLGTGTEEWTKSTLSHGLKEFRDTANAVCAQSFDPPPPCRNHCEDRFRLDAGLGADAPLTCDYYKDYVFGSKCDGNTPVGGATGSWGGHIGGTSGSSYYTYDGHESSVGEPHSGGSH